MRDFNLDGFDQVRINIPASDMLKAGKLAIKLIRTRTLEGRDADGKDFKAYSTKPFAMPLAAIPKRAVRVIKTETGLGVFTAASGALWAVVKGGYLAYKSAVYKKTDYSGKPNLTLTGQMLRSLTVIASNDNTFTIGFNRAEDAQKAFWNAEKGREFLGLSPDELSNTEFTDLLLKRVKIG